VRSHRHGKSYKVKWWEDSDIVPKSTRIHRASRSRLGAGKIVEVHNAALHNDYKAVALVYNLYSSSVIISKVIIYTILYETKTQIVLSIRS